MEKNESLALTLIRHPFVWSGLGLWVRYYDRQTTRAQFFKVAGTLLLGAGALHSGMNYYSQPITLKKIA